MRRSAAHVKYKLLGEVFSGKANNDPISSRPAAKGGSVDGGRAGRERGNARMTGSAIKAIQRA